MENQKYHFRNSSSKSSRKILERGKIDTFNAKFIIIITSVDTEMCCPKGKCGCQYFILLTLKKKKIQGNRGPGIFFYKKTNPGLIFLLKVQSCVFISNFHHSPPPPPKRYKIVSLIIN